MNKKYIRLALSLIALVCSAVLMGFWINHTNNAQQQVNAIQNDLTDANEALAKAYADMPWTITQINADIDQNFVGNQNIWLKNRVSELRAQGYGFTPSAEAEEKAQYYASTNNTQAEINAEVDWAVKQGFIPSQYSDWIKSRVAEIRG